MSGLLRDSQETADVMEAAGSQTAPPVPSESYAGHACVSTERVRPSLRILPLISLFSRGDATPVECYASTPLSSLTFYFLFPSPYRCLILF